jgi:hypothetical protein
MLQMHSELKPSVTGSIILIQAEGVDDPINKCAIQQFS